MFDYGRSGQPFSITYITYDKKRGSGGAVKSVERAVLCTHVKGDDNTARVSNPVTLNYSIKNPNHFNNSTLNIRVVAGGQADIRKVHVQLIRKFNGATVK